MASESILKQKQGVVEELKAKINASIAGVLVDYKGINVADDTKLRRELREAGISYGVAKNTMLKLAIQGTELESLTELLEGTTAVAMSTDDYVAAAKILSKYAEDSKSTFAIKGGFMDGKPMSAEEVNALAKLPSKEGLLSMLCSALQGNIRGLAVALNAIAEKAEEQPSAE